MEYTVPSGKVFAGDQVSCYPLMLLSTVFWYIAKVMSALSFQKKKKRIKKDQNSSTWKTPLDLSCRRAVSWWRASTELHLTVWQTKVQLHRDACSFFPDKCLSLLLYSLPHSTVLALLPSTLLPAGACFCSLLQILPASVCLTHWRLVLLWSSYVW